jgi:hypothetical protein
MRLTEKPAAKDTERDALIKRELDAVIGDRYVERTSESAPLRLRRKAMKWLLGAVLAIAMATSIALVLHKHLVQPQAAPDPAKPVVIRILPPRK